MVSSSPVCVESGLRVTVVAACAVSLCATQPVGATTNGALSIRSLLCSLSLSIRMVCAVNISGVVQLHLILCIKTKYFGIWFPLMEGMRLINS